MRQEIVIGKTYEVPCPFLRSTYEEFDEGGSSQLPTWKPGIEWVTYGDSYFNVSEPSADGLGKVLYTVVDVHKLPRPYPPRVFFTRKWVDPDGKTFGKGALRIMTVEAFRRRLTGYLAQGLADDPDRFTGLVEHLESTASDLNLRGVDAALSNMRVAV